MPDGKRDITHFTKYFGLEMPRAPYLALILLLLGAATGILAELILSFMSSSPYSIALYGASAGIVMVALPAMLTAILIKVMNRRLKLRHAFVGVIAVSIAYSLFLIADAVIFRFTQSYVLVYIVFLLANGFIYGYWFMISRVVFNHRKSPVVTAAIQPLLNILLYLPASGYLLSIQLPLNLVLIKLWAAMLVFLVCGYSILYVMDRPSKRELNFSGVELMGAMINQWLYDVVHDNDILKDSGIERDVPVELLVLQKGRTDRAVFVKPEIHYGPIAGVGGAGTTEHLGAELAKAGATPFVLHGGVNLEDNPISANQIPKLSRSVLSRLNSLPGSSFSEAKGAFAIGQAGPCRAIAIKINDLCMIMLTKAPRVTEDLDREVGRYLAGVARRYVKNVILLDAHNTRFESASDDELRGVYPGSKYVKLYERAIHSAMKELSKRPPLQLNFGSASSTPSSSIHRKDLGKGPLSVAIFRFGSRSFCIVYFDSNNLLPSFRKSILSHIKSKYGMDAEVCTTDTHAVNTLSLSAANVLGRETTPAMILPALDLLLGKAVKSTGPVRASYSLFMLKDFKVWGHGSEDTVTKVSRDIIHLGKKRLPLLIAAFFILAVCAIYIV